MSVAASVKADLDVIRKVAPEIADSALAAAALALAERMDDPETSATAVSNCAHELREIVATMRQLVPPVAKADDVDELNRRREQRRGTA